jgi:hypothetical protein
LRENLTFHFTPKNCYETEKQKKFIFFFVSLAILVANYGHSRKKHNFATTFFAKNNPLTTTYTFFGLKQNKPRKNTTNRLPKSSEI